MQTQPGAEGAGWPEPMTQPAHSRVSRRLFWGNPAYNLEQASNSDLAFIFVGNAPQESIQCSTATGSPAANTDAPNLFCALK